MSLAEVQQTLAKANSLFVDEDFDGALSSYNEAVSGAQKLCDSSSNEAAVQVLTEALTARSSCQHKRGKFVEALSDAQIAVARSPNSYKAYLRKGMAAFSLEEYESAKSAFADGVKIAPESQQAHFRTWIRKCEAELADENEDEDEDTAPLGHPQHTKPQVVPATPPSTPADPSYMSNRPDSSTSQLSTSVPAQSPNTEPVVEKPKYRHEWFQTATHVTVEVFVKGRKKEQVKVQFQSKNIDVSMALDGGSEYNLNLDLADEIEVEACKFEVLSTKIEIKLKKSRSVKWETLEAPNDPTAKSVKQWDSVEDKSAPKATLYPSSSRQAAKTGRDWDKLAKDSGADEEEKLEGDAALNKVFAGIYKNASDEQRKAMLKSFQESGGTVLSTNWEDVGKGPVKGSPPNGMEMKQWKDLDH